ncbi:MAG: sensor histidine kinase [Terriglobia bacterium]
MPVKGKISRGYRDNVGAVSGERAQGGWGAGLLSSSMAGFICHDLRHPLSAILAYSELLAEDALDRPQRADFHQEIRRAVTRMNDLISLVLEFSKGSSPARSELADIADSVGRAIQVVAVRPEFRGIVIEYEHEGLANGWFDPGRLQQVIINVVLNACEAVSPDTGRVDVRSLGRKEFLEISVQDNGPGISPHLRHAIFQPFVSYGKEGGTGLGLAIVQKILRDHGGEIYLESSSAGGSLFRIVLPFVRHLMNASPSANAIRGRNPAVQCC